MKKGALYGALVFVLIGALVMYESRKPRGIRNNNPLNIRNNPNNVWFGKIGTDSKDFVVFDNPENGYRAAVKILNSYRKRGLMTLTDIISAWAPPTENDTDSYINSVSDKTGIKPLEQVLYDDYAVLLMAMTYHENGVFPYDMDTINEGVRLANG